MNDPLSSLVPTALLEELLSIAMSKGGDFAELYLERTRGNSVSLEENQIRSAAYGSSLGMGIRVIKGSEVGYAYSDDLD
ncbi:MAG: DNA gyrase modulator, partial [Myxococcota bacterium]